MKRWFLVFNYVLGALLLFLAVRHTDLALVFRSLGGVRPGYAALAFLAALSVRLFFTAFLWREILGRCSVRADFADIFRINGLTLALKYSTPLKISELVRSGASKLLLDIPFPVALASSLFLRFAALMGSLAVFCLSAAAAGAYGWLRGGLLALGAGLLLMFSFKPALRLLGERGFVRDAAASLALLRGRDKVFIVALAAVMGGLEIFGYYMAMLSAGLNPGPAAAFYGASKILLLSSIPVSVQGIGLREGLYMLEFGAYPAEAGFLSGLLVTFLCNLAPAAAGGLWWLLSRRPAALGVPEKIV